VLEMARQVGRRARLAMLTNNGPLLFEHFEAFFPQAAALFGDNVFFSGVLGLAKPSAAAFHKVIGNMNATPAGTLFIDDGAEYVAGARDAGLMTHHFKSAAALHADLTIHGLL
jgi:HAD superfamily hydrolase (TIGR01509 family)